MKRLISLALMCLMLLTLHLAAYADGSFSVAYGGCKPGNEYSLFILKNEREGIIPDNILFMDQLDTTNSNGAVYLLLDMPNFTDGTVWLGGEFPDNGPSPRKIGSVPEEPIRTPAMLTEIGESAFEGDEFTHVYLGDGVTSIGSRAFADCGELVYIYIPDSVTEIEDDAFDGSRPNMVIGCRGGAASSYADAHGISYKILD